MAGEKEQRDGTFEEVQIRKNAARGKCRVSQGKSCGGIKLKGLKQNILKGWTAQRRQNEGLSTSEVKKRVVLSRRKLKGRNDS